MKRKINIIVAGNQDIFRWGLKSILNQNDDFNIIGEANSCLKLIKLLDRLIPDIILIDYEMPDGIIFDCLEGVSNKFPEIKLILLSSYVCELDYSELLELGVKGFVLKHISINELENAIHNVYEGSNYFSQELLKKLMEHSINGLIAYKNPKVKLTNREQEILELISEGLSNLEISEKLFISPSTVNNHRANLLTKTDTKNTAALIMYAIKKQLISVKVD